MKKLIVAFVFGFMFVVCSVHVDAHPGCRYRDCIDPCIDKVRACAERCDEGDSKKVDECKRECYAKSRECNEHCDEKHHDPSC